MSRRVNRFLYPRGFALLSDHFYQPLPPRSTLVHHAQDIPAVMDTVDGQLVEVDRLRDRWAVEEIDAFGYGHGPTQLPRVDAEVLYATIRDTKPARVVEIGSGSSTTVIAAALHRNAVEDGRRSTFVSIDPFATPQIVGELDRLVTFEHLAQPLQVVAPEVWETLAADDVLFVDSSHVFKPGSDVEFEFLHVYPSLAAGVLVHVHDIFFPHDYPLEWTLGESRFWNEQHVLAAVLSNSDRFEVRYCLSAIHDRRALTDTHVPGSIWLRKLPPAGRSGSRGRNRTT